MKTSNLEYFQTALNVALAKYGITQKELAKKTGISQARISEYSLGKTEPGYKKIVEIAEAFNLDVIDFLTLGRSSGRNEKSPEMSSPNWLKPHLDQLKDLSKDEQAAIKSVLKAFKKG